MPLLLFRCSKCSRERHLFDDELVDGAVPTDNQDCPDGCVWEKVVSKVSSATYTKSYTTHHPQWDSLKTANKQLKGWDGELEKDVHDQKFRQYDRKA